MMRMASDLSATDSQHGIQAQQFSSDRASPPTWNQFHCVVTSGPIPCRTLKGVTVVLQEDNGGMGAKRGCVNSPIAMLIYRVDHGLCYYKLRRGE
jgi:hypothetical protein